ncbi:4-hydroxy-3-methylbut-2-enyl diphosphate reductase [Novosphingobium rosa]|uniref:4-hydroxy-3-methylbut-2-enyl diphosphate reductase n=1 Tax=Novosphingobium rosa TaxID=76978 RepID=UPI0024812FB7|nr:4-hydroxy-3-methylbut-2-enyl diphosphate reductase [Novosphingobium rosa]
MLNVPLRVIMASPRGFCAGVERAIAIVEQAIEAHDAPVYVRHEIVHNARVVKDLEAQGAIFVEELDQIPDGAVTIFSAHGVPASVEAEAQRRALPVYDATCPLVSKVHNHGLRFAREGRNIVLIGHAGHAEVEGTLGQIPAPVHLVATPEDVAALPLVDDAPVAYLTQTTLSVDETRAVIAALQTRFADCVGPDVADICYATQNRQTAVRALAERVDAIVVVGAANSSNSTRLAEIARSCGVPAWLVSDADAFDPAWLNGIMRLGVTAGASAPDVLVQELIARLGQTRDLSVSELDGIRENVSFSLPPALRRMGLRTAQAG